MIGRAASDCRCGCAAGGAAGIIQGHLLSWRGSSRAGRCREALLSSVGLAAAAQPARRTAVWADGRLGGSTCCDLNDLYGRGTDMGQATNRVHRR